MVCDVGGGTADFTLIAVAAAEAGLSQALERHRIAVGEHILLGGDNMDLALAYALKDQMSAEGHEIDHWQFLSLVHAARAAKERLLGDAAIAEIPIAVPTRGASLFAKTLSTTLSRAKAMALIIDGYFPRTEVTELPKARKSVGLQEFGLDYATEPAFSKHLARFLTRARENVRSDQPCRNCWVTGRKAAMHPSYGRARCFSTAASSTPRSCARGCWRCSVRGWNRSPR